MVINLVDDEQKEPITVEPTKPKRKTNRTTQKKKKDQQLENSEENLEQNEAVVNEKQEQPDDLALPSQDEPKEKPKPKPKTAKTKKTQKKKKDQKEEEENKKGKGVDEQQLLSNFADPEAMEQQKKDEEMLFPKSSQKE